ncbi:unnamed protein product [Acanthoscelides obtectus]|uniref:Secreted protein n=1 Tax=Acanthoscelides obtectus TaxID=200917 RepID=A0A9P0PT83_ACAOB|nr:unnamed protein product [Acanthoscelides obtectus]CAK1657286.1 hypothetical protein AOBTE_LOCUS20272 [Acanthoscelides obtectus]
MLINLCVITVICTKTVFSVLHGPACKLKESLLATTLVKSKKEAETAIQLWLRRASDRNTYQMNKKL